jgi:hypothetical protein
LTEFSAQFAPNDFWRLAVSPKFTMSTFFKFDDDCRFTSFTISAERSLRFLAKVAKVTVYDFRMKFYDFGSSRVHDFRRSTISSILRFTFSAQIYGAKSNDLRFSAKEGSRWCSRQIGYDRYPVVQPCLSHVVAKAHLGVNHPCWVGSNMPPVCPIL